MIVVRVELHSAVTKRVTELARMYITNVGGTRTQGDYEVEVLRGRSFLELNKRNVNKHGEVKKHPRLAQHVWHLVAKALASTGYAEHIDDHKHPGHKRKREVHAGSPSDRALCPPVSGEGGGA